MLDKKTFDTLRKQLEEYDNKREQLIRTSRDLLQNSKATIYSLHRNDIKTAEKQLRSAQDHIKHVNTAICQEPALAQTGAWTEALEEYVEAHLYHCFVKENKLPTAKELNVDIYTYLAGVSDLAGELVRRAINAALKEDYKTFFTIKDYIAELYEELMLFDLRNSPARRKFDAIKYGLEKLEDLGLKIKLKER